MRYRTGRNQHRRSFATLGLVVSMSWMLAIPLASTTAAANNGTLGALDVDPDISSVAPGTTVTFTATLFDTDGNLFDGPGTNTQVRFYFLVGSPNDPHPATAPI